MSAIPQNVLESQQATLNNLFAAQGQLLQGFEKAGWSEPESAAQLAGTSGWPIPASYQRQRRARRCGPVAKRGQA